MNTASDEWNNLEEETREEMGLTKDHDGEFWMSIEDFQECWSKLEVLNAQQRFVVVVIVIKYLQLTTYEIIVPSLQRLLPLALLH